MHLVVVHGWQKDEAEVAKTIADTLGILVFEARQKISGGGPAMLASFADPHQAASLATRLCQDGVPTLVIDSEAVRDKSQPFHVRRFVLGPQALQLESFDGELCEIGYSTIALLLVATRSSGGGQTTSS